MPVQVSPTPNPNALKYEVGVEVGGPKAFAAGKETDDPIASAILALPGVTSVFMSADFITVSKQAEAPWDGIALEAKTILEEHFG